MDINHKNETTGEGEMVGVGLFLEDIKQEPKTESDISYFFANNEPLNIKSEDFVNVEHVSKNREERPDVEFFANNDPLNINSEDVEVVVKNGLSIVPKTTELANNMLGEIIEAISVIKQENYGVLMEEDSAATSIFVTKSENIFDTLPGKPTCELCGFTFATPRGLKKHEIVHKNPSEVCMYKCAKCAFESKHKQYLKTHILNLHGSPSQLKKFSCEMCDYKTNYKYCFKKHLVLKHSPLREFTKTEKKVYKCESCQYTTKKKFRLEKHSLVHKTPSELTMNKCPLCPYQSKHESGVPNHMFSRHKSASETPLYKCELCSFVSKWRHCLRNHIKTHENNSEYPTIRKCEACDFTSNNIYSLKTHMKSHVATKREKIFICFTCGFQAKRKPQLIHHMLSHKHRSQLELFECAMCGLRTKSKANLKYHVLIKHGPIANVEIKPNF